MKKITNTDTVVSEIGLCKMINKKESDHKSYMKRRHPNTKIGKLETKVAELEREVAEKDKEIGKLLAGHLEKCFVDFKRGHDKKIRHDICEEIRKKAEHRISLYKDGSESYTIRLQDLDQIERGEE